MTLLLYVDDKVFWVVARALLFGCWVVTRALLCGCSCALDFY